MAAVAAVTVHGQGLARLWLFAAASRGDKIRVCLSLAAGPPMPEFTDAELEAFLDESLHPARAQEVEAALVEDRKLLRRLSRINGRRDAGMHTLGEIWRRNQIGVPTPEQLGKYLLGILDEEEADYIRFRVETLKCPYTLASLNDLQQQQAETRDQMETRRRKYYNSGVGLIRPDEQGDD
jgi:hypothetical protein